MKFRVRFFSYFNRSFMFLKVSRLGYVYETHSEIDATVFDSYDEAVVAAQSYGSQHLYKYIEVK